jgi:hypothetical protein
VSVLAEAQHYIALYFIERGNVAWRASLRLEALVADELRRLWLSERTPVLPFWRGSILDFNSAWERWGVPEIYCVTIGFRSRADADAMLNAILARPPLGLIDHDRVAEEPEQQHLAPGGLLLPGAVMYRDVTTPRVERDTGVRIIGFRDEIDSGVFDFAMHGARHDAEYAALADEMVIRLLSQALGYRYAPVSAASGFAALVEHAAELLVSGAYGAAGAVAGVAFEQLMRASLSEQDRAWLAASTNHVNLGTVIDKVVSSRGLQPTRARLDSYRGLRNSLAHRLGDHGGSNDDDLFERVDGFIAWLELQSVDDDGVATLVDVPAAATYTNADLLARALSAGKSAAETARTTPMVVSGQKVDEGAFGAVRVTVTDTRRAFTRWLRIQPGTFQDPQGVSLSAPYPSLERGLAWAHAVSETLTNLGHISCGYTATLT